MSNKNIKELALEPCQMWGSYQNSLQAGGLPNAIVILPLTWSELPTVPGSSPRGHRWKAHCNTLGPYHFDSSCPSRWPLCGVPRTPWHMPTLALALARARPVWSVPRQPSLNAALTPGNPQGSSEGSAPGPFKPCWPQFQPPWQVTWQPRIPQLAPTLVSAVFSGSFCVEHPRTLACTYISRQPRLHQPVPTSVLAIPTV